uniref:Ig-like domain-containing protein n=2 Tax=Sinocyclocheilus anshuiensis TaxID=1608454 RepID=A0A671QCK4_9TELE
MCFVSLIDLFMWSQATESLTNTAVTLGADVNISCDLDIEEIYWYRQKSPDPPVFILRTFDSTYEEGIHQNSIFKLKYLVKTNSRLFIRNITTDELGVYYCVKTSEPLKFSNGTNIYISDCFHKNLTSESHESESHDAPQHQILWRNLTIASVLLNVLLTIALIGLRKSYLHTRRFKNSSENPQSTTAAQYLNDSQYAEVDFSMHPGENRPCQEQTIYSLLQPIKSMK